MITKRRLILVAVIAGFGLIAFIFLRTTAANSDCTNRANIIPETPLYPGSVLLSTRTILDNQSHAIIWKEYSTNAAFAEVSKFYSGMEICDSNGAVCTGSHMAKPFGSFMVSIKDSASGTTYGVQTSWDRCGGSFEKSVE
jgi:hypothetical protein